MDDDIIRTTVNTTSAPATPLEIAAADQPPSFSTLQLHQDQVTTATAARFDTCWRILNHVHVVILLITVYAALIGLAQLKYQSKKESPFETHTFFMIMSIAAIIIFAPTYWTLYHHNTNQENDSNRANQLSDHSPSVAQMILVSVAFLSIVLALLSLVFVLILPPNVMWIGYLATCLLLISMIAYTCIDKVISLGKNMLMPISTLVNYIRNKF